MHAAVLAICLGHASSNANVVVLPAGTAVNAAQRPAFSVAETSSKSAPAHHSVHHSHSSHTHHGHNDAIHLHRRPKASERRKNSGAYHRANQRRRRSLESAAANGGRWCAEAQLSAFE